MKYVPEDKYLLDRQKIKVDNKEFKKKDLEDYLKQKPNKRILGVKFHLFLYNLSKPGKEKGLSNWLREIGEEPVVFDEYMAYKTKEQLKSFFDNKGYFHSKVTDTVKYKNQKAKVLYKIKTNEPYKIGEIDYSIEDSTIQEIVDDFLAKTLIQSGDNYDVDVLEAERKRIEDLLKNIGYFNFSKEFIYYEADSSSTERIVDLEMNIRQYPKKLNEDSVYLIDHPKYIINNVYMFTDFDPKAALAQKSEYYKALDTSFIDGIYFIQKTDQKLNTKILLQSNFIAPGAYYNYEDINKTHQHFTSLRLFRLINIQFSELDSLYDKENNIGYVDCFIQLTKFKLQSFTVEIEGTNSSGNIGIGGNLLYQHKSLFHGAEIFDLRFNGSIETLNESNISRINNTLELGAELGVTIPKFVLPIFRAEKFSKKYSPSTRIAFGYNYQDRPDYTRTIANLSFGYNWKGAKNTSHYFSPVELNAVKIPYASEEFRNFIDSSYLRSSYENHFVSVSSYSFVYNNQDIRKSRDFVFLRLNGEISGNILSGVYELIGAEPVDGSYEIFGIPYSQFVKADMDFRYYKIFDEASNIAFRFFAGAGLPYGNSEGLPFEKKYFSGGANSVRAWNVRDLGPGSFSGSSPTRFPNQTADIKLETNLEYRFKLFWVLEGAIFMDVGNIWSIKQDGREGSLFTFDNFYNELAVGTGVGARFNFSFFIFRLDLGIKLHDPAQPSGERWIPGNRNFVNDDFTLNIGIGYPF